MTREPYAIERRRLLALTFALAMPTKAQTKEKKMNPWPEMDVLKRSSGQHYIDMRDAILRTPELRSRIENASPAADWRDRIHMLILRGWLEQGDLFREVLATVAAINAEVEKKKITGFPGVLRVFAARAEKQWKEPIVPLIWEILMKYHGAMPPWKQMIFLSMASALPHALSVEPIIEFMEHTPEPAAIDFAGTVLQAQPPKAVKLAVEKLLKAEPAENHAKVREVLEKVLKQLPE